MAAMKKTPSARSSPQVTGLREGAVHVSITNQYGQRYRYHARAVSLSMKNGVMRVAENEGGCFVWFDRCELEVRDARNTLLFHLKSGAASKVPGTELAILAELAPASQRMKRPRAKLARSRSRGSTTQAT